MFSTKLSTQRHSVRPREIVRYRKDIRKKFNAQWNSGTAKYLGACFSIIHHRNHAGASDRASLIKDTGAPWFLPQPPSRLKSGVSRAAGSIVARTEAIFRSFRGNRSQRADRGIPHDLAVISRNKQSEIILLSTFFALTRRWRRTAAYVHAIRKWILPITI